MKRKKTKFKDLLIFKSKSFKDSRGFFREIFLEKIANKKIVFSVISKSKKNVLRGLHLQTKNPQGKYLSVLKGKIFDVSIDLRKKSKTYLKYFPIYLSEKNGLSIYIPPGFGHGFLCLDKENIVAYGCTKYRDKKSETGVKWDDPDLNIKWPVKKPILSSKDKNNISLKEFLK